MCDFRYNYGFVICKHNMTAHSENHEFGGVQGQLSFEVKHNVELVNQSIRRCF